MTGESLVREEVREFAVLMEMELRENDYKGGWADCNNIFLVRKLLEETFELIFTLKDLQYSNKFNLNDEIERARIAAIIGSKKELNTQSEAADVANVAMMLADNNGGLVVSDPPSEKVHSYSSGN